MFSQFRKIITKCKIQQILGYTVNNLKREFLENKYHVHHSTVPFYIAALWSIAKRNDTEKSLTNREFLLAKADALFDQEEYNEIYKLLSSYKDNKDVEILWRLSRALYKMSKLESKMTEAKKLVYEGYDLILQALKLQEDHWAVHKWIAILLNSKTTYEGTKNKIKELYNIKSHMVRAVELNPKDASTLYMIGNWCYEIADLAWYQRKIASLIFGEPPISSFEEALEYFERAEYAEPNFYGQNLLMLGKTCLKLNKQEDAIKYLKMASEFLAKNDDDQEAKQEAQKMLSSL